MSMIVEGPRKAARPVSGRRDSGPSVWPLMTRLHFYAGVLVAPFLALAALTGLAYALAPQLDRLVYGHELRVERVAGTRRPLSEQIQAVRAAYPEGALDAVVPPATAEATTQVVLKAPGLGERRRTVYVDPYTGRVTGALTTRRGATPITGWLGEAHSDLHLGAPGRLYLELAASWLWVIAAGGALLWACRRRHYRGGAPMRRMLWHDRGARGVRRTRGRHAAAGLWLAPGLVVLSLTGLSWSDHAGTRVEVLESHLAAPRLDTALASHAGAGFMKGALASPGGDAPRPDGFPPPDPAASADRVLAAARTAGLSGPVEIGPAGAAGKAWTVTQTDNTWPVHKDQVAVDPATGAVTSRVDWADRPLPTRLRFLGSQLHRGPLFGPVNQVVLAAVALGLLAVVFWGYWMWWQRRPTRDDRRALFGRPPARAAWRRLPVPALLAGIPVLVALVWAMPVLGMSLPVFLLVDGVIGLVQRRRSGQAAP
jgi:uncharacterized iron-regulated membrane protein